MLVLAGCPSADKGLSADEQEEVRSRLQSLAAFLDSPGYAKAVSWDEHVVLTYRLTQDREPMPDEYLLLRDLRERTSISRSRALSQAMRGRETSLSWEHCRVLLEQISSSNFRATPDVAAVARRLSRLSWTSVAESLPPEEKGLDVSPLPTHATTPSYEAGVAYNTYFGYLHAHSALSDGNGTAFDAYTYARDQGGMDFFALTDHAEQLVSWPWENKWAELVDVAEQTYAPGSYVTLWGFEWTNPIWGHVNILNSQDFTNAFITPRLKGLFRWLSRRPEAFGRFNHPGRQDDLGLEFMHLRPSARAIPQMVGIELLNKSDGLDRYYYDGSWDSACSYWDAGNRQGWHLGPLAGQDNHGGDWGTRNQFRTAVLAEDLTREAIVDAYKKRRFYCTEDKDLCLDFRCQGYPMGSRLTGVQREFEVAAHDNSGDFFEEVRLYRNGDLLEIAPVSGNAFSVHFSDEESSGADYYYVIVRQTDDNDGDGRNDEAASSPIWCDYSAPAAGCSGVNDTAQQRSASAAMGDLSTIAATLALLLAAAARRRYRKEGN